MRQIKFRAWDLKKQDWYKPIYEAYNGKLHDISITLVGVVMERTLEFSASMLNSDNYILCQFTGLTDKNGVEIYEGDVVKSIFQYKNEEPKEILAVVKYDELNPCFVLEYKYQGNGFLTHEYDFIQCGLRKNEVIGNIYQNPELLK